MLLAEVYKIVSLADKKNKDYEAAEKNIQISIGYYTQLLNRFNTPEAQLNLSNTLVEKALILKKQKRLKESKEILEQQLSILKNLEEVLNSRDAINSYIKTFKELSKIEKSLKQKYKNERKLLKKEIIKTNSSMRFINEVILGFGIVELCCLLYLLVYIPLKFFVFKDNHLGNLYGYMSYESFINSYKSIFNLNMSSIILALSLFLLLLTNYRLAWDLTSYVKSYKDKFLGWIVPLGAVIILSYSGYLFYNSYIIFIGENLYFNSTYLMFTQNKLIEVIYVAFIMFLPLLESTYIIKFTNVERINSSLANYNKDFNKRDVNLTGAPSYDLATFEEMKKDLKKSFKGMANLFKPEMALEYCCEESVKYEYLPQDRFREIISFYDLNDFINTENFTLKDEKIVVNEDLMKAYARAAYDKYHVENNYTFDEFFYYERKEAMRKFYPDSNFEFSTIAQAKSIINKVQIKKLIKYYGIFILMNPIVIYLLTKWIEFLQVYVVKVLVYM